MSATVDLVTLGETLVRLQAPVIGPLRHVRSLDVGVAGAESNVAIGVRRLGGRAAWVGRVGDDEFGRLVLATLRGEGLDVTRAIVDPGGPTALLLKEQRTSTLSRVHYYRSGSAGSRLGPDDVPEELIRTAGLLHLTGITVALSASARLAVQAAVEVARAAGVPISVDLNYRKALWEPDVAGGYLRELVERADIVFATEPEARLVVDGGSPRELAAALGKLGPAEALVKRGPDGVVAYCDGQEHAAPAVPVLVVDPVGAGDAFAAAYLVERARGLPVADRIATALAAGAYAVSVPGDWEGLPTRADLTLFATADDQVQR